MSDYTSTFTESTGDTIDASDFSTEFDAIEASSATKADLAAPALTGAATLRGVALYGMVILDEPETLFDTGPTTGSWQDSSGFASTTLSSNGAVAAILHFEYTASDTVSSLANGVSVRKKGATNSVRICHDGRYGGSAVALDIRAIGQGVVNLDASSDFEYFVPTVVGLSTENLKIQLVGYYV